MSTHMNDFINEQDPFCDYFSECSCGLNSIHACCHAPCHVGNGLDSETESLPPVLFVKNCHGHGVLFMKKNNYKDTRQSFHKCKLNFCFS